MSRRAPVPAESFTGAAVEVQCPGCGDIERHRAATFYRADPTVPIQPGEVIQVRALCFKRASRLPQQFTAGSTASYFIKLPNAITQL